MIGLSLSLQGEYRGKVYHEDLLQIGAFKKYLGDWSPAFRFIAHDVLEGFVTEQFKSEGAEGGITWQELAPSTVKQRGSEHPILERSGDLEESFMEGGTDHVEDINEKEMTWGSAKPYALFHQTGTQKGFQKDRVAVGKGTGRGMARRRILVINKPLTDRMMLAMQSRLVQVARQIGYGVSGTPGARMISPGEARQIGNEILGFEA